MVTAMRSDLPSSWFLGNLGTRTANPMTDIVDKATRSRMMASITAKDTKPEHVLRRALHAHGFRFRLHVRGLPGTPDLVLRRYRAVCFVHGCFWHRHEGSYATTPATRPEFWQAKFDDNVERDVGFSKPVGASLLYGNARSRAMSVP